MLNIKHWILKKALNIEYEVLNIEYKVLNIEYIKYWILNIKFWILNLKFCILNLKYWILNTKYWILNIKYWILLPTGSDSPALILIERHLIKPFIKATIGSSLNKQVSWFTWNISDQVRISTIKHNQKINGSYKTRMKMEKIHVNSSGSSGQEISA